MQALEACRHRVGAEKSFSLIVDVLLLVQITQGGGYEINEF